MSVKLNLRTCEQVIGVSTGMQEKHWMIGLFFGHNAKILDDLDKSYKRFSLWSFKRYRDKLIENKVK